MVTEVGVFPLIFSFSILLVFLQRFYRRYMRPCLISGERPRAIKGFGLIIFSIAGSMLMRLYGL